MHPGMSWIILVHPGPRSNRPSTSFDPGRDPPRPLHGAVTERQAWKEAPSTGAPLHLHETGRFSYRRVHHPADTKSQSHRCASRADRLCKPYGLLSQGLWWPTSTCVGDRLSSVLWTLSKASSGATPASSLQRLAWPQTFETSIKAHSPANVRFSVLGIQVWHSPRLREFRCQTHHQSRLPGGPVCLALFSNVPWLARVDNDDSWWVTKCHKSSRTSPIFFTVFQGHGRL